MDAARPMQSREVRGGGGIFEEKKYSPFRKISVSGDLYPEMKSKPRSAEPWSQPKPKALAPSGATRR